MLSQIRSLLKDESGATAVEYALLLAMVAIVIAAFGTGIGDKVKGIFQVIQDKLPTPS